MAEEKAAGDLGKIPEALERRRTVEISGGAKVSIEKWSITKYGKMSLLALQDDHEREVVTESLIKDDRGKVATMSDDDVQVVLAAAIEFNIDEVRLKNSLRLTKARLAMAEAMNKSEQ